MTYETIFSRRFSKHDQKKIGSGAIICFFLMAFTLCSVFKPYIGPLPPSKCMHYSFLNFSCFISLVSISCASCMNTKTDARHLQLFSCILHAQIKQTIIAWCTIYWKCCTVRWESGAGARTRMVAGFHTRVRAQGGAGE